VPAPAQQSPLTEILATRIRANGPITFAKFMEVCLYHLEHGYYTRAGQRRLGDYYTSVDMHPVFGRLLARQLAEMWEVLGRPQHFFAVECGAAAGHLAGHILDFAARALPQFYDTLQYVAVEYSTARRALHSERLAAHAKAGKVVSASELPAAISAGCIFSNELLDALPVHRVQQVREGLQEIFLDWRDGAFIEKLAVPSTLFLPQYFAEQGIALPEGAQAEVCFAACDWIQAAGRALGSGFVLTVDYGHEARQLYDERHARGTVLAYHEHRASEDLFAFPGQQDLTAHVNFTALDHWGQKAGLRRLGLVSQTKFLMALGRRNDFADVYDEGMNEVERLRARLNLKSLIHPEGMGETFSVMVQGKGVEDVKLTGLKEL